VLCFVWGRSWILKHVLVRHCVAPGERIASVWHKPGALRFCVDERNKLFKIIHTEWDVYIPVTTALREVHAILCADLLTVSRECCHLFPRYKEFKQRTWLQPFPTECEFGHLLQRKETYRDFPISNVSTEIIRFSKQVVVYFPHLRKNVGLWYHHSVCVSVCTRINFWISW
jgi:hypothetical protein